MCRLGRTADALLRSAAMLERTLAHHQKMPAAFFGVVIQDEVDIPALEAIWASRTPASAGTGSRTSAAAGSPASAITPPPAPPQPAPGRPGPRALVPGVGQVAPSPDPRPDPEPTPATPPRPQAQPDQSPDPTTQPGEPPATPRTRPAAPDWVFEKLDQGPGYSREVLRRRTAADPLPEPAA